MSAVRNAHVARACLAITIAAVLLPTTGMARYRKPKPAHTPVPSHTAAPLVSIIAGIIDENEVVGCYGITLTVRQSGKTTTYPNAFRGDPGKCFATLQALAGQATFSVSPTSPNTEGLTPNPTTAPPVTKIVGPNSSVYFTYSVK